MADLWEPKRRIEREYQQQLTSLTRQLGNLIAGATDPQWIVSALKHAVASPAFNRYLQAASMQMVTNLFTDTGRTWRKAAAANSRGREIRDALKKELAGPMGGAVSAQVSRNAGIIKTLPLELADQITDYIADQAMQGVRASDIASAIQQMFPERSQAKAELIARTETSKTSTALTQARAELMGLPWYVWRTSTDARVRQSHKLMDRVLVRWADPPAPERLAGEKNPPAPYNAGEIYNCRCYPEPLLDIDDVSWPHKVYYGNLIVVMTRAQFKSKG